MGNEKITIVDVTGDGDVRFPISGHRFKQDHIWATETRRYDCTERSDWASDNGIKYQFCTFTLAQ